MHIFLQPEDVLLFRDGKPFNQGEEHYARSIFPPLPSTVQGAIRSHYLIYKEIPLDDQSKIIETVGTADDFKGLRIRGPFIAKYNNQTLTRYFPTPADAFVIDDKGTAVRPAMLRKNPGMNSHTYLNYLLYKPRNVTQTKKKPAPWMSETELHEYFQGNDAQAMPEEYLFKSETRLGITLKADHTRSTEEGMLYQVDFIRLREDVGLYLEVSGFDDFPSSGLMRIGGEGHGVMFSTVAAPHPWSVPDPLPPRFKLYFTTPAYFEHGWEPADWGTFFEGQTPQLEAVALAGWQIASGFDYAQKRPKSTRRYVPAGSVYYFSCAGNTRLTTDAISEYGAAIGFGQILVAEWKED